VSGGLVDAESKGGFIELDWAELLGAARDPAYTSDSCHELGALADEIAASRRARLDHVRADFAEQTLTFAIAAVFTVLVRILGATQAIELLLDAVSLPLPVAGPVAFFSRLCPTASGKIDRSDGRDSGSRREGVQCLGRVQRLRLSSSALLWGLFVFRASAEAHQEKDCETTHAAEDRANPELGQALVVDAKRDVGELDLARACREQARVDELVVDDI